MNEQENQNQIKLAEVVETSDVELEEFKQKSAAKEPSIGSVEWSDWVVSQFEEDELPGGRPNISGLRRLVEKIIGDVISVDVELNQCPNYQNKYHAVATARVSIARKGRTEVWTDVADAYPENVQDVKFQIFPTAIAGTRAESRALKKALRLRNIVTSDEVCGLKEVNDNKITKAQIAGITMMCNKLGLDLTKFMNSGKQTYRSIEDIQYTTAIKMLAGLSKFQNGELEIPENLKKGEQ